MSKFLAYLVYYGGFPFVILLMLVVISFVMFKMMMEGMCMFIDQLMEPWYWAQDKIAKQGTKK